MFSDWKINIAPTAQLDYRVVGPQNPVEKLGWPGESSLMLTVPGYDNESFLSGGDQRFTFILNKLNHPRRLQYRNSIWFSTEDVRQNFAGLVAEVNFANPLESNCYTAMFRVFEDGGENKGIVELRKGKPFDTSAFLLGSYVDNANFLAPVPYIELDGQLYPIAYFISLELRKVLSGDLAIKVGFGYGMYPLSALAIDDKLAFRLGDSSLGAAGALFSPKAFMAGWTENPQPLYSEEVIEYTDTSPLLQTTKCGFGGRLSSKIIFDEFELREANDL